MSAESAGTFLNLRILTPEGAVLEGEVHEVIIPGSEGELGILPSHAALLTRIAPGRLAYRAPEGAGALAIGRGVAEVRDDRVIILVDRAIAEEDIRADQLEARRKEIAAEMQDGAITGERLASLEEELLLIDVQLRVARREETAH